MKRLSAVSCVLVVSLGLGCGKVQDIAQSAGDAAKDAMEQAKTTVQPADPPAAKSASSESPATPVATIDPEHSVKKLLSAAPGEITDGQLAEIANWGTVAEQVTSLDLGTNTQITDDGIGFLSHCTNLEKLDLSNTAVTARGVARLKDLPHLKWLNLANNQGVDDAAAAELGRFKALTYLSLNSDPVSDDGLANLVSAETLQELDLSGFKITQAGMAAVAGLSNLKSLRINHGQSTMELPHGLRELTASKSLTHLELSACGIPDEYMVAFRSWPRLESLGLANNPLTDQAAVILKQLNNLRELDISMTKIGNPGLSQLGNRKLEKLNLSQTAVDDAGMTLLKRFAGLRVLDLSLTSVTDQGMVQLKGLKNLEELSLNQTQVGDRGLSQLVGLKNLKKLWTDKTVITDEGRAAIAQAIPGLKVDPVEVDRP